MSAYSSYQQQSAAADMEKYQSQVAANNAAIAQQQAQNAEDQGQLALQKQQDKNAQMLAGARAQMAAGGLDISSGSPLLVQQSDSTLGDLDAQTIRDNTINQVYGDNANAMNQMAASDADAFKSNMSTWNQNMGLLQTGITKAPDWLNSGINALSASNSAISPAQAGDAAAPVSMATALA